MNKNNKNDINDIKKQIDYWGIVPTRMYMSKSVYDDILNFQAGYYYICY